MRDRRKFSEISASWLAGRVSIAREDGADGACWDTIAAALDHYTSQA